VAILFDRSHGTGVLSGTWPAPYRTIATGYAGGLGPDNLQEQLDRINRVVPVNVPIWVDMETKLRSPDNLTFDLDKCQRVVEITERWIKEATV
jgi:hypothetical protein